MPLPFFVTSKRAASAAIIGALAASPFPPASQAFAQSLALTHATVLDMTGAAPRRDFTVVVSDGRITAVGPAATTSVPAGARVVDASGAVLIPGLWDMHVHLARAGSGALPVLVANGVTSVRDLSTDLGTIGAWRRAIARGDLVGPRIIASGAVLDGPEHPSADKLVIASAADAKRVVDSLADAGADFVKLYDFVPREAYFAAFSAAKARRLPVIGRVPRNVKLTEAADAGIRTLERLSGVPLPCPFSMRLVSHAPGLGDIVPPCGSDGDRATAFAYLKARGIALTPTLASLEGLVRADAKGANDDPLLRYASPALRASWKEKLAKWPRAVPTSYRRDLIKLFLPTTGQADRAGVRILAGTDVGSPYVIPGFALHDELALLVKAGLTPMEALQAATRNAAAAAGQGGSSGTIEVGKVADLVLLDGDPLADIRNSRRIRAVVLRGRLLDRAALEGLLR